MTQSIHRIFAAGTLMAILATGAAAQERTINETRAVDAKARISIENLAGLVDVTGWDRNEVQITGTLDEKATKLDISGGGHALTIEVQYPDQRNLNIDKGSRLILKVPRGCELEVESVSAAITVADVAGKVSAESVSGNVTVRGAPSDLEIETVSGEIDVEVAGASMDLASVSGSILARGVSSDLEASTVSGEIEVIGSGPIAQLETESVSGSMKVVATPAASARWDLSAHAGNIDLTVPSGVNARFAIGTFSGNIRDAFGHEAARTNEYAPGSELTFTQGSGGAEIDIESFSGNVAINKK